MTERERDKKKRKREEESEREKSQKGEEREKKTYREIKSGRRLKRKEKEDIMRRSFNILNKIKITLKTCIYVEKTCGHRVINIY